MALNISTVLCLAIFILCCTGVLEKTCARFRVSPGSVAALSLLLAGVSSIEFSITEHVSIHVATLLAAFCGVLLCLRTRCGFAILLAFVCGLGARLLLGAFPQVYEPGALAALPAAILGRFLIHGRRRGLLCTLLSPLFYGLLVTFEDWYLFDFTKFSLGSVLQFDMQLCGAVLYVILLSVPVRGLVLRKNAQTMPQKEG